jgi:hypothetical protein
MRLAHLAAATEPMRGLVETEELKELGLVGAPQGIAKATAVGKQTNGE